MSNASPPLEAHLIRRNVRYQATRPSLVGRLRKSGRLACRRRRRENTAPAHDHAAAVMPPVAIVPIDTAPFRQMARAALDDR